MAGQALRAELPLSSSRQVPLAPLDVARLLRDSGLRPHKGLGQNFLQDDAILARIAALAEPDPGDSILEVGPGLGSLTRHLALQARQVVAVELDGRLIPVLERVLKPFPNVTILQGDILALDPASLPLGKGYLAVANIPYYITSALFRHLLSASQRPRRMVLTVQKEVAGRICAAPGQLSLLALSVQVYGKPVVAGQIPAGAFYPAPTVDSAVVRVDLYPQPLFQGADLDVFFRLSKAGFSQKRKTLRNSLSAGLAWPAAAAGTLLESANLDPMRRAETLSLEEWAMLVAEYQAMRQDQPRK